MKTLPNYFYLYLRFLKAHFSLYIYLFLTFAPLVIGGIANGAKNGIGFGINSTVDSDDFIFQLVHLIEEIGIILNKFFSIFGFSKDITDLISFGTYSILLYLTVYFIVFAMIELNYLKYRLKGLSTQEIQETIKNEKIKSNKKDKNDY